MQISHIFICLCAYVSWREKGTAATDSFVFLVINQELFVGGAVGRNYDLTIDDGNTLEAPDLYRIHLLFLS